MDVKFVNSHVYPMKDVFSSKYIVDFYQRAYVWSKKHMEDIVIDLSSDFLRQWKSDYTPKDVENLDPYFMGEIILAAQEGFAPSQMMPPTFPSVLMIAAET